MSDDLSIPSPTYRVPRHGRRAGMDPALQRLMIYAGGLIAAGVVIGGVSLLFNRHSGPVPVVQADPRPLRVKPENPGGMQIAGINADGSADGNQGGKLAPPPEAPDPSSLRASGNSSAQTETATARVAPPAVVTPRAASQSATPSAPAVTQQRTVTAAPAAPKPAPAPAVHPATVAAMPVPVMPAAHAVAAPVAKAPTSGKTASVQLAALSSEDAAKTEWQHLEHRMPDVLGGKAPTYSKVELGGRTYWRLRLPGFSDVAQAKAFCDRVRAKNASCSVADF